MDRKTSEELVRRLAAALQAAPTIVFGFFGDEVVVDSHRLPRGTASLIGFARDLREREIERITLSRGLSRDEVRILLTMLGAPPRCLRSPSSRSSTT